MTKATRILNEFHIKEMLLHGKPQFENFYKEELIQFCEIAQKLLQDRENRVTNALVLLETRFTKSWQTFHDELQAALKGSDNK